MAKAGDGNYWAVKSPGVGTKKEGKSLVLRQHQHFSLIAQSNSAVLNIYILMCDFFVLSNVFLWNSAKIRINTSRRDDMHQFMVLVLM